MATSEPVAKRQRRAAPTGGEEVLRTRRPRALDADLIRYFRQLEVTLVSFKEEAAAGGGNDHSEMLVAAALREMKNSEASAASHKHCSHVVEKLLSIASGLALRQFMHNAAGFALHMCTNRYASHVVQVMLKRASKLLFAPEAASSEVEDEDAPPPMAELIASFCGELEQDWAIVIQDPSGSHAARTLLELLRGDGGRDGSAAAAVSSIVTPLPSPAAEMLGGIVPSICDNLLQLGWSTLRKVASTHHSGGTLTLLVEALAAHQRQLRLLRINLLSDSRQTPSEALVKLTSYASGSRVVESLVRVSSGKGGCDGELFELVAERQTVRALSLSSHGNYVAQALVKTCAPSAPQLRRIRRRLQGVLPALLVASRGSVAVVAALHVRSGGEGDAERDGEAEAFGLHVIQVLSELAGADASCTALVPWLLQRCGAGEGGAAAAPSVGSAGAQLAQSLLHCGDACRDAIVRSILTLDDEQLIAIGQHSHASRNILEPILESTASTRQQRDAETLIRRFCKNCAVVFRIASHGVGRHVVCKAFKAGTINSKTILAKALLKAKKNLGDGSSIGRSVQHDCGLRLFSTDRRAWIKQNTPAKK